MKNIRPSMAGAAVLLVLLAGCSADTSSNDASSEPATSASASAEAAAPSADGQGGDQAGAQARGGLTGEIAFVSDGLLQVQDGNLQTAVRYTDDTTMTQQIGLALSDIEVGACVFGFVDEDSVASQLTVSEPVDGECSTGFAGGERTAGDAPGGAAPGADVVGGAAPGADTLPSGAPEADASAAPPEGVDGTTRTGTSGSLVSGTVTQVGTDGISVEDADGASTEVSLGADSIVTGTGAATADDLEVGLCATARGEADDAGGYDASALKLSTPGDDGCVTQASAATGRGAGGPGDAGERPSGVAPGAESGS